jgi:hypothetical protein
VEQGKPKKSVEKSGKKPGKYDMTFEQAMKKIAVDANKKTKKNV